MNDRRINNDKSNTCSTIRKSMNGCKILFYSLYFFFEPLYAFICLHRHLMLIWSILAYLTYMFIPCFYMTLYLKDVNILITAHNRFSNIYLTFIMCYARYTKRFTWIITFNPSKNLQMKKIEV